MGVQHVRRYFRRLACRGLVLACTVGLGLIPTFGAQAAVVQGSITGFVPNPFGGGGNYVRANDVRFTLQRAITAYSATALGRTVAGEAALQLAPTAGRAIATACFSNPVGIAGCTTVAALAWYGLSKIRWNSADQDWEKDVDVYGPCYYTYRDGGQGAISLGCSISIASAASTWVNTSNADNFGDAPGPNPKVECDWAMTSLPTSVAINGSGGMHVNKHCVASYTNGQATSITNTDTLIAIRRSPDGKTVDTFPATQTDMANHGNANPPPDDVVNDYGGPVPTLSPDFSKGVGTAGDPYAGDDTPSEGPWKQDRVTTVGKPDTTDPMDLDTGTDTVNVDNPNTPGDEGDGDPDDPGTPGDPQTDAIDICKEHPNISACQPLGEPPDDEVPKSTKDIQFQAEEVPLPETCPAPIQIGSHGTFDFENACEVATRMRPLVIALAALIATIIMSEAIRRA